jgi:hypothetical protein
MAKKKMTEEEKAKAEWEALTPEEKQAAIRANLGDDAHKVLGEETPDGEGPGLLTEEELAPANVPATTTKAASKAVGKARDIVLETIIDINRIMEGAYKNAMMEIGRLVVKNFFKQQKKPNIWKAPIKTKSYQDLINNERLGISKTNLWNCVQVALQESFLNVQEEVDVSHLTFSHLLTLTKIKKRKDKILWIQKLKRTPLSVAQFEIALEKTGQIVPSQKALGFFKSLAKTYADIPSFEFDKMDKESLMKQAKIKDEAEFYRQVDAWLATFEKAIKDLNAFKNIITITPTPPIQTSE